MRCTRAGIALCCLIVPVFTPCGIAADTTPDALQVQLRPVAEAMLSSRMAGTITRLALQPGDEFRKGDMLLAFDCALAEQDSRKAQADLDSSRATLASNLKLRELNSISELEIEVARAQEDKAAAEFDRTRTQLGFCTVKAPWDGRVVERRSHPLENVAVGQPLLAITAAGTPTVQMFVPSTALPKLPVGTRFDVSIRETGASYGARVVRTGARVDAVSQTIEVFGEFLEPHLELLPGMSGSAALPSGSAHD